MSCLFDYWKHFSISMMKNFLHLAYMSPKHFSCISIRLHARYQFTCSILPFLFHAKWVKNECKRKSKWEVVPRHSFMLRLVFLIVLRISTPFVYISEKKRKEKMHSKNTRKLNNNRYYHIRIIHCYDTTSTQYWYKLIY